MSILIVSVISIFFIYRYYCALNTIYKTLPKTRKNNARKYFAMMAGGLLLANIITAAVSKPKPIIAGILATLCIAFVVSLIIKVKIWTRQVPAYDEHNNKIYDSKGDVVTTGVKDKKLCAKTLFAIWCLSIPTAVCLVYAKASLAGSNFSHPIKTLLSFFWVFILPLVVVGLVAFVHYSIISGLAMRFADWFEGDSEADEEEPDEEPDHRETSTTEDIYSDSSLDPNSIANWWKRNWVIVIVAVLLVVCAAVCCHIILHTYGIL